MNGERSVQCSGERGEHFVACSSEQSSRSGERRSRTFLRRHALAELMHAQRWPWTLSRSRQEAASSVGLSFSSQFD